MSDRRKAIFLDRDGVINLDHGYVSRIEDIEFLNGIFPVLRTLAEKGYALIVVTNQSGIGRGYYTEEDFERVMEWILKQFDAESIPIAGVYRCPHTPESNCDCRKPAPGMFLQAIREHSIDPAASWMVGDNESDMLAAKTAGISNRVLIGGAESENSTHSISEIYDLLELPV